MKKGTPFLTILCILFSFSCGKAKTADRDPLDDFKTVREITLKGDPVRLANDSVLYDPRDFRIIDTLAFLYDNVGTTGLSVVGLKSGKLLRRFAYAGNGSAEFNLNALTLSQPMDDSSVLIVSQWNAPNRLYKYRIDSLLKNNDYKPTYFYQFPHGLEFRSSILENDSVLVGRFDAAELDKNFYGIFHLKSSKLITGVNIPVLSDDRNSKYYDSGYLEWTHRTLGGTLEFRPDGSHRIAYFSSKGAFFQIFKTNGGTGFDVLKQQLYYLPAFTVIKQGNKIHVKLEPDCRNSYNNFAVTKDRIYALYSGRPAATKGDHDLNANTVLVYDWEGNAIEKLHLPADCYKIAIDASKPDQLYALRSFDSIGIIRYQLPQ